MIPTHQLRISADTEYQSDTKHVYLTAYNSKTESWLNNVTYSGNNEFYNDID